MILVKQRHKPQFDGLCHLQSGKSLEVDLIDLCGGFSKQGYPMVPLDPQTIHLGVPLSLGNPHMTQIGIPSFHPISSGCFQRLKPPRFPMSLGPETGKKCGCCGFRLAACPWYPPKKNLDMDGFQLVMELPQELDGE